MTLNVRLVNHQKTIFVTKLVKNRRVRIMTRADCIEIMLLHQCQIQFHLIKTDYWTCHRVGIMPVHAAEFDGLPIQKYTLLLDINLAYPHRIRDGLPLRHQHKLIQIGRFCIPQDRICNFQSDICYILIRCPLHSYLRHKFAVCAIKACPRRNDFIKICKLY